MKHNYDDQGVCRLCGSAAKTPSCGGPIDPGPQDVVVQRSPLRTMLFRAAYVVAGFTFIPGTFFYLSHPDPFTFNAAVVLAYTGAVVGVGLSAATILGIILLRWLKR